MSVEDKSEKTEVIQPAPAQEVANLPSDTRWTTTRVELWSYYLYYIGNSGLSGCAALIVL